MSGHRNYVRWGLVTLALIFGAGAFLWFLYPAPNLKEWQEGPPPRLWASAERQKQVWGGDVGRLRFVYCPLEKMSQHLLVAVLVAEDINFFRHSGVDLSPWPEVFRQWRAGHRLRGASTLTQQLAKNLFLSPRRSLGRKLRELRLAWLLEKKLGKRRILELYLNLVEFGPGLYGAEAAAQAYFNCSAAELTLEQAASLAAAIPAPSRDNPKTFSAGFRARRAVILRRATKASWLYELAKQVKAR
ncbi:MAG: transglycosylase domain-containing protein [Thermoanaerobaculaceae bacterium]